MCKQWASPVYGENISVLPGVNKTPLNGVIMFVLLMMCCFFLCEIQIVSAKTIVSPSEITQGESLNVTCDASRAGVPNSVITVTNLYIYGNPDTLYALYRTYISPYTISPPPDAFTSKNRTFNYHGSLQGTSYRPNNRNTMTIEMMVYDVTCFEYYFVCRAVYLDVNGAETWTQHSQYIDIATNTISSKALTLDPQYNVGRSEDESVNPIGSNVTLTCEIYGPKKLNFIWKFGNSSAYVDNLQMYQEESDITVFEPEYFDWLPTSLCDIYHHKSQLRFQIKDTSDAIKYVCLVTISKTDTYVGDKTIHTKKSIINPIVIEEGKKFYVMCDASLAGVPNDAATVLSLKIEWTNGTHDPITYAEYTPFQQPSNTSLTPETRNWTFVFKDGMDGSADRDIKRDSMFVDMMVYDAKCTDAGMYVCTATYNNSNSFEEFSTSRNQSIVSLPRAVPLSLTLVPQYEEGQGPYESVNLEGSNITLTCNATGPENLSIKWKFRNSSLEKASSSLYLGQNGQQFNFPLQVSFGTTCVQYLHSSTLKLQLEKDIGGYVFFCVATANNEETIVGNMTIHVKPNNITTGKNVNSHDIVNPSVIVEGGSFTVTCDAKRAGVPSSATTVSNLFIAWTNGTAPPTTYARYRKFIAPYNVSFLPKTSPPRNWTFTFSGSQQDIPNPNNTDTMKIEMVVYDANSTDEGVYFCNATYLDDEKSEIMVYRFQLVKNETATEAQRSERNDYSFLYYIIPVAVLIVVGVSLATVCFAKVRRKRAIQRRRDIRTLPAIREESLSPPMDSNGYLLPVDPNGGYAQIIDIAPYETSANYYSSINELEFIKESDQQFEYRSGFEQNQDDELDTKKDVKLGIKTDTQVDIETRQRLDIQNEIQPETKTDEQLDINPQNDSTPADELNDYTKLYDTTEDLHSPDVNKYSAPIFESVI